MSDASPIPLDAQAAKLGRILDDRIKLYRLTARKQPARLEEMSAKHAECEAIRRTFAWFVANADWIRDMAQRRRAHAEAIAEIERHPAVAALRETFSEGATHVRDLPTLTDAIEQETEIAE